MHDEVFFLSLSSFIPCSLYNLELSSMSCLCVFCADGPVCIGGRQEDSFFSSSYMYIPIWLFYVSLLFPFVIGLSINFYIVNVNESNTNRIEIFDLSIKIECSDVQAERKRASTDSRMNRLLIN